MLHGIKMIIIVMHTIIDNNHHSIGTMEDKGTKNGEWLEQ
jgi:hypothetical protein